ncbi:MAG: A/G-specific adenine glycosylase [Herbinix sp.]|jgi:A/G-specific adenine glycosylase|nr:A/G-specific adenine glycosylase [Herbinix sp.]
MTYDYQEIIPYLLHWFDHNARILPWRENPKPYYVWISEIMLQQTRVEAVKGYFDRFITALPDIESLAKADEEKLLKLWEGLGYYNRVRNLQKAAQLVMKDYNGKLPADYEPLLKLPGIGAYTAGAIASIAFGIPVPAVDGNVLRVCKRISASFDDITKETVKRELWLDLKDIMPKDRPGDFNQALMELGAIVCLPNGKPLCENCPVMHLCKSFHEELISQIPVKPVKNKRRLEDKTVLLIEYQNSYVIHKRSSQGLLAGLWELPLMEASLSQEQVEEKLKEWQLDIQSVAAMGEAKHIFSHIEWHMLGYHIKLSGISEQFLEEHAYLLATEEEIRYKYALPNAFSAYSGQWK